MDPEGPTAPLREDLEIPPGLGGLDHAEGVSMAGHRKVLGVVAGHLHEDAAGRAPFVGLSRRMQEARAEAETCRDTLAVANRMPRLLEKLLVAGVHREVGQQREIVTRPEPAEVSPEIGHQRALPANRPVQLFRVPPVREQANAAFLEEGTLAGERAGPL